MIVAGRRVGLRCGRAAVRASHVGLEKEVPTPADHVARERRHALECTTTGAAPGEALAHDAVAVVWLAMFAPGHCHPPRRL